jgi:hypothetical protein
MCRQSFHTPNADESMVRKRHCTWCGRILPKSPSTKDLVSSPPEAEGQKAQRQQEGHPTLHRSPYTEAFSDLPLMPPRRSNSENLATWGGLIKSFLPLRS